MQKHRSLREIPTEIDLRSICMVSACYVALGWVGASCSRDPDRRGGGEWGLLSVKFHPWKLLSKSLIAKYNPEWKSGGPDFWLEALHQVEDNHHHRAYSDLRVCSKLLTARNIRNGTSYVWSASWLAEGIIPPFSRQDSLRSSVCVDLLKYNISNSFEQICSAIIRLWQSEEIKHRSIDGEA